MSFLLHVKNYSQKYTMCMHIMLSRDVHGYVHLVHQDSQISFRLIFVTSWAIHTSIGIWYTSSTLIPEASSNYCREMRLRHPRQFRFIHSHSTQEFSFSIFHFPSSITAPPHQLLRNLLNYVRLNQIYIKFTSSLVFLCLKSLNHLRSSPPPLR